MARASGTPVSFRESPSIVAEYRRPFNLGPARRARPSLPRPDSTGRRDRWGPERSISQIGGHRLLVEGLPVEPGPRGGREVPPDHLDIDGRLSQGLGQIGSDHLLVLTQPVVILLYFLL